MTAPFPRYALLIQNSFDFLKENRYIEIAGEILRKTKNICSESSARPYLLAEREQHNQKKAQWMKAPLGLRREALFREEKAHATYLSDG